MATGYNKYVIDTVSSRVQTGSSSVLHEIEDTSRFLDLETEQKWNDLIASEHFSHDGRQAVKSKRGFR